MGLVTRSANDGVDPVGKLRDRGKGVWVQAGTTASPDEGVNPMDQPVADKRPTGVPLCVEPD